ncbi:MAG: ABC transporter permease [Actinobacteria bacterium]|nr:MAG: ABC transporter permease [Actinomycetota bacterium]REK37914.1 MAG: ABC transporter permease [Actinomycetota bacterium]
MEAGRTMSSRWRRVLSFIVVTFVLIAIWEGYKLIWLQMGWIRPVRPDNTTMPHVWDMIIELFRPVRRGGDLLILDLAARSFFTLREAFLGFVIGGIFGFALSVLFVRSTLLERSFMPYVVASQTIPIIAIAPMVVVWGGRLDFPQWLSVAVISAYLTFFPVAINTLRGLKSPDPTALELMRSYAAKPREVLWKLQVPSALPYIFTALKVSATASVIGALIGELPAGFGDGLGRALLTFSQQFGARSVKLYATVIVTALVGVIFVTVVTLVERKTLAAGSRDFEVELMTGRATG